MEKIREIVILVIIFIFFSLIVTYPLVLKLDGVTSFKDSRMYMWSIWWFKHKTVDRLENPFYTNHICHPNQISLYFQNRSPLLMILTIPLTYFLTVEVIYNLLVILSFILTAFGTCMLSQYLTKSREAGIVSGILFALSPIRYHWISLGWINALSIQWTPIYLYFLLKSIQENKLKDKILAGLFLAFTALTFYEHLLYCGILTILIIAYTLLVTKPGSTRRLLTDTALIFTVFFIISSPVIIPSIIESIPPSYVNPTLNEVIDDSADAFGLIVPSPENIIFGEYTSGIYDKFKSKQFSMISFAGFTTLFLALIGVLRADKKETMIWLIIAGLFYLLSLGPIIHFIGEDTGLPGPYGLMRKIPFMGMMRFVNRFTIVTQLSIAILAGWGFLELSKKITRKKTSVLIVIVFIAAFAESYSVPDYTEGFKDLPAYSQMKDSMGNVIHIPYRSNDAMYIQAKHGLPIVNCFLVRKPIRYNQERKKLLKLQPVINNLKHPERTSMEESMEDKKILNEYEIQFITVEKEYYKGDVQDLIDYTSSMNARIIGQDDDLIIFSLD